MIRPPVSTPSAPDVASTQRDAQRAVAKSIAATPLIDLRTVKQPVATAPAGDVWTPSARLVTLASGGAPGAAPQTLAAAVEVAVEVPPINAREGTATPAPVDDAAVSNTARAEAKAPAPRDAATSAKAVAVALDEAAHPEAPSPARALPAPVRDAREFGREPRARAPLGRGAGEASTVAGEVTARARRGAEVDGARTMPGEVAPAVARSREGSAARATLTVAELEAHVDAHGLDRDGGARLATPGVGLVEGAALGYAPGVAPHIDAIDAARDTPPLGWIALFREAPRRIQQRPLLWLVVVVSWAAVLVAAWYATAR